MLEFTKIIETSFLMGVYQMGLQGGFSIPVRMYSTIISDLWFLAMYLEGIYSHLNIKPTSHLKPYLKSLY